MWRAGFSALGFRVWGLGSWGLHSGLGLGARGTSQVG